MNETRIQYLAEQKANGLLTTTEQSELQSWLAVEPTNARAFEDLLEILQKTSAALDAVDPQTDRMWAALQVEMNADATNSEEATPVIPMQRKSLPWTMIAAGVAALLVIGLWAGGTFSPGGEIAETTYVASGKLEKQVLLEDGSLVQLQPGAKLTVSEEYNQIERRLTLTGQAYFEVKHDPERPFIVGAGNTETKVLGTRFHVNVAGEQTLVKVSVVQGKVSFSSQQHGAEQILTAKEAAVFNHGKGIITKVQDLDPSRVQENMAPAVLSVKDMPLEELVPRLETFYEVKVEVPEDLLKSRITATFMSGDPGEEMAEVLKLILQCEATESDKVFSFTH